MSPKHQNLPLPLKIWVIIQSRVIVLFLKSHQWKSYNVTLVKKYFRLFLFNSSVIHQVQREGGEERKREREREREREKKKKL